jgi:hypothetical protein
MLSSSNSSLDGLYLYACHTGAAISTLCVDKNFSPSVFEYDGNNPSQGIISRSIRLSNMGSIHGSLKLAYATSSNLATVVLTPGGNGIPAVLEQDFLALPSEIDDSTSPPSYHSETLQRWYMCEVRLIESTTTQVTNSCRLCARAIEGKPCHG